MRDCSAASTPVFEAIRSAIISGRLEPAQRLVEKDLCELLGVSRVSVREALLQLEAEGFIDTVPHRGPVVIQPTSADVRKLYDVLSILEAQAARLFTQNATADEVDASEDSIRDIARTYRRGSADDRLAAKTRCRPMSERSFRPLRRASLATSCSSKAACVLAF